ncbi:hypothetical protein KsCSTR_16130 [Candidatus Kuenenia stuttgartiensis]|uniref:Uncharacterized protein n=1 Tax=Kuenenia stuttgartiensis TaxID=174633 RepID=Q1Q1T5_KUEST|nr:hypothetical protein KsCSTR_16130 [Candidatus Kuenenia stuttgartiensis]CAJ73969.1 unknown protein [Candidatus Kuenenia stuttgartiensis]
MTGKIKGEWCISTPFYGPLAHVSLPYKYFFPPVPHNTRTSFTRIRLCKYFTSYLSSSSKGGEREVSIWLRRCHARYYSSLLTNTLL